MCLLGFHFKKCSFHFYTFFKIVVNSHKILNISVLENIENVITMNVMMNINILHVFSFKSWYIIKGILFPRWLLRCLFILVPYTFQCPTDILQLLRSKYFIFWLFLLLPFQCLIRKHYAWFLKDVWGHIVVKI